MKDKKNIWHLIWIVGMYLILISILLLIIEYKVKWENKDLNTYLYFYSCSGSLCTTSDKVDNYYGKVKCENKVCPHIKERSDDLLIMAYSDKEYIYDYKKDSIASEKYQTYSFANGEAIVKNSDGKYGVIDISGNVLVEPTYNKINDYKNGIIAYAENEKVGVASTDEKITIKPTYEDVIIISADKYAYLEDNKYYIASYDTELPINNQAYDYIYATDDIVVIIKDKKLDILSDKMESQLLLKIDTTYEYTKGEERRSLNFRKENNLLHFNVVENSGETEYIFDLNHKKLI